MLALERVPEMYYTQNKQKNTNMNSSKQGEKKVGETHNVCNTSAIPKHIQINSISSIHTVHHGL